MKRKESLATFNREKCEKYLKYNIYQGQRNLREKHVLDLAQKIEDGRFHVASIATIDVDGDIFLMDGQHTLTAGTLANKPFKALLQEYVAEEVDSEIDIANVFSQFNVDKGRTNTDITWIYACQLGWGDWPKRCPSLMASGISLVYSGKFQRNPGLTKDAMGQLLAQNTRFCQFGHDVMFGKEVGKTSQHLQRAPVVAAMFMGWQKNKAESETFWLGVRDGENLTKADPQWRLREYLKSVSLGTGGSRIGDDKKWADSRELFVKTAHAWNAFRKGTKTDLKYYPTSKVPRFL